MSLPESSDEFEIEPLPENLLRAPLDFLFADHYRQRVLCGLLRRLVDPSAPPPDSVHLARLIEFLERDLPLHHQDEELDLFPWLRQRCPPEDNLHDMLEILATEHVADELITASIVGHLRLIRDDPTEGASPGFAGAVAMFNATQQRHLIWENVVVLPLARRRLLPSDLDAIGRAMAERRHVAFPD